MAEPTRQYETMFLQAKLYLKVFAFFKLAHYWSISVKEEIYLDFRDFLQQLFYNVGNRRSFFADMKNNLTLNPEEFIVSFIHTCLLLSHFTTLRSQAVFSVTRCWRKKLPKLFKSCPKSIHSIFLYHFSKQPKTCPSTFGLLLKDICPKNFQNSPNLVTLVGVFYGKPKILKQILVFIFTTD